MGACYQDVRLPGTMSRKEVTDRFKEIQDNDRYENGHSYSGGLGMADGLEFREQAFLNVSSARHWLEENAVKWEAALAVRCEPPDGGGEAEWVIGAWCSS